MPSNAMNQSISLSEYGITVPNVLRNASPAELYEHSIRYDGGLVLSSGAILPTPVPRKAAVPATSA